MSPFGLLVPARCLACRAVGPPPLCPDCDTTLEPDGVLHHLTPGAATLAAWAYTGALPDAIKAVKTGGLREGAQALAGLLPVPDVGCPVTWVPAPRARRRRRGLDLPQVLAGPTAVRLLDRLGDPPEQPDLDARQRRAAQAGTFRARGPVPPRVVLVDDVRATGSTLLAAAGALRRAGARRVLCLTLAAAAGPPSAPGRRYGPGAGAASAWAPTW